VVTRVLWLTKGLGPGGSERLLVEVGRRIDRTRVDVTTAYVLPWKDHLAGELEAAGVATLCLSRRDTDPAWPLRLRSLMADFDVVHSHSPIPAVAARLGARSIARRRRPVTMSTEHNTWSSHHPATRLANRATSALDAATFAVTEEARESMSGRAAARAEVLVHGVDVRRIARRGPDVRVEMRASLGIAPDEIVLGTVANLTAQKDYPNLLAAARSLADRGVAFRLLAVGQGPLEDEVRRWRDDLGLAEQVQLLGFRPDAVDVMAACDAFVLASAWEGLPVAVMEATALGLPIVATRVGGVQESLDPTCALLVQPRHPEALADALETIVTDCSQRAALAAGARRAAERFDVARAVERLTDCYEACAGSGGAAYRPAGAAPDPRPGVTDSSDIAVHRPHRDTPPSTLLPHEEAITAPARRRVPAGYELRPITDDDESAVIRLLEQSLGWAGDHRSRELFRWKHLDNPFGRSPGWVAVHDRDGVVGVRLFMRWRFRRGSNTIDAVRAVDTATHPDHQRHGLFTALTLSALDTCGAEGVAWVFNTPNDQSRPGYLQMGWREIGRLPTAVRPTSARHLATIANSRLPAERWSLPIDIGTDVATWLARRSIDRAGPDVSVSSSDRRLRTDTTDDVLRWRYGMPRLHYRVVADDLATVLVRLRLRGAGRELVIADRLGDPGRADALAGRVAVEVGATHALRLGRADLRRGFVPLPGSGPILTWRALTDHGPPPLCNWHLGLGDIELL
jgi:glycosyltransferase involved in cell wall biosynthesis/GNAT superfamily N-acetyltransferase